jgi:hypothetical protein
LPQGLSDLRASLSAHSPLNEPSAIVMAYENQFGATQTWAAMHRDHQAAVILVTDGHDDEACGGSDTDWTPLDAVQFLYTANAQYVFDDLPSVPTFVLGVGSDRQLLDALAGAGATQVAVMATATAATASGEALLAHVSEVARCTVRRPSQASDRAGLGRVNVRLVDGGGASRLVPALSDSSKCGPGGGWFYDNRTDPRAIVLCHSSCAQLVASPQARVDLVTGCPTVCGPGDVPVVTACNDGVDNDHNGLVDLEQLSCLTPCQNFESRIE